MAKGARDERDESPMYLGALLLGVFLLFGFLIWLVASNRIVYNSLSPGLTVGALWKLIPSDYTYSQWNYVVAAVQRFAPNPTAVSFIEWGGFVTVALRPLMLLLLAVYVGFLITLAFRGKPDLKRKITADMLMRQSMKFFTGVAPVIALRKQISADKHPLWRRQVTPEEVFLNYKVPRTKSPSTGSLATPGMPMLREGKFDREVARAYFVGAEAITSDGRLISRMLGRQIVNLPKDAAKAKSSVFSDRMTNEGKALIGLWGAVAFGGKEGRDEYSLYRDKLNLSAFNTTDGIANLALAQPLYAKYRKHPLLNKLFSIHHWEHTVLFALLALAQKKGRYTTAEVLWLRPLNRVMYFSLNTRGSFTPHTESATTFTHHAYETVCAKLGRLPLMHDATGALIHVIYVDKAVDGLELECLRWLDADSDDDDDWWQKKDIWTRASPTVARADEAIKAAIPKEAMPGVEDGSTAFDAMASAAGERAEAARTAASEAAFADFVTGLNK